jgi:hypothetical protein
LVWAAGRWGARCGPRRSHLDCRAPKVLSPISCHLISIRNSASAERAIEGSIPGDPAGVDGQISADATIAAMPSSLNEDRGELVRAHVLQTYPGEELKAAFGWQVLCVESGKAAAQILLRQLPIRLRLAHVPRRPWGHWLPVLLPALDEACHAAGAFALTIEPDALGDASLADELGARGFRPNRETTRPRRTLVVSQSGTEDDVLPRIHPKARYTTRLAAKKGVRLGAGDDLEAYGERMQPTASRDRFRARRPIYCAHAHALFRSSGTCELRVARHRVRICSASAPCTPEPLSCAARPSRRARIARQDHRETPARARSPGEVAERGDR